MKAIKNTDLISGIDNRDYSIKDIIPIFYKLPATFQSKKIKTKYQHFSSTCVCYAITNVVNYCRQHKHLSPVDWSKEMIYCESREVNDVTEGLSSRRAIKATEKLGTGLWIDGKWSHSQYPIIQKHYLKDKDNKHYDPIDKYYKLNGIEEIKQAVYKFGACMITFPIYNTNYLLSKSLKIGTRIKGYHAVCCIGWNEKGLIIHDSYSIFAHNNGLAIVPYDYPLRDCWALLVNDIKVEQENTFIKGFKVFSYIVQLIAEDIDYYTKKLFRRKK